MDRTVAFAPLWNRIWARRKPISILVISATLAVGIIAFFMPTWYLGQAELLPPGEEETGMGLAMLMRGIAVPGVRIPTQVTPADVFIAILGSRRISDQMVDRFDLRRRYHKKLRTDAILELQEHARFKLTEAGSIKISVEDTDRQRAADMANAYAELLDQFNRQTRMTKGRRTRMFVEQRLTDTRQELAGAEQRLADYQSQHKAAVLTPNMSSAVDEAARLYARRMTLEV